MLAIINKIVFYIKIIFFYAKANHIIYGNIQYSESNKPQNIGLILAGGNSTRFGIGTPKQLMIYNNKTLIEYSIDSLINVLDIIIIVTNSKCHKKILEIISNYPNNNFYTIINDKDCRLASIETGLQYISTKIPNYLQTIDKIIITDSARPFIPNEYIENLLANTKHYSQYCLKLTNGLMNKTTLKSMNRDNYIELCSPICMRYDLCQFIFEKFISENNRYFHEFIDILQVYNIPMNFIFGTFAYLRKITYYDDLNL